MLNPAFALVSMNKAPNSRALLSPSSIETCLLNHQEQPYLKKFNQIDEAIFRICLGLASLSLFYLLWTRSVLLPTRAMMTWLPLSARTSSIHLEVLINDCLSASLQELLSTEDRTRQVSWSKSYTCYVIDNDSNRRISDITWYQAFESLLSSRVPAHRLSQYLEHKVYIKCTLIVSFTR